MSPTFVDVDVVPCAAAEDGAQRRFKRSSDGIERIVTALAYESEDGLAGVWRVRGVDDDAADAHGRAAIAYRVEDSSDGTVWLVVGGSHGLRLEHTETGTLAREPYLLLSLTTELR